MDTENSVIYDAIIVGGGPAGLSAAIYLARAKYRVLVLEREQFGGQITITSEIVNYPGVHKTSGSELTENMRLQGEDFGAEYRLENVKEMELSGDIKKLKAQSGKEYRAVCVLLALGANPRKIGFQGEREYQGRGVAYCATCDGEFFTGKDVIVVGGGFAAVEESMFLTRYARKITIMVREEKFTCAEGVVEKLKDYPSIEVMFNTEVVRVTGDKVLKQVSYINNKTGEEKVYRSEDGGAIGLFVFAGYVPDTKGLEDKVALDDKGYIITDVNRKTSKEGVYAAGDVCIKNLRQVVTAVSDGATAATSMEKAITECKQRLGLPKWEGKPKQEEKKAKGGGHFVESAMKEQLEEVFAGFDLPITITAMLSGGERDNELLEFAEEFSGIHEKVSVKAEKVNISKEGTSLNKASYIDIIRNGKSAGIRYYSVPGGHEFNSFIAALYNVAGPGKPLSEGTMERVKKLGGPHKLMVMTTLSCTNCPAVVMGTQKLAALREDIEAEMYDVAKFPGLKDKYNIMAVPCLVIDDNKISFGKKGLEEILELIEAED